MKDACRERLEKNLVSQAFEERLYQRGPVHGRLDPRPFLKIWEPRYRKFLEVATELHAQMEAEDAKGRPREMRYAPAVRAAAPPPPVRATDRQPRTVMIERNAANPRRKSRSRSRSRRELRPRVEAAGRQAASPGLAVVLVGHNPASEIYVRNKIKTCHDLGIYSESLTPPDTISTEELLAIVEELNARPEIDGILVQLPLPAAGGHEADSAGRCAREGRGRLPSVQCRRTWCAGLPGPRACTPAGIIETAEALRHSRSPGSARWSSDAATSSASRSRCCCCTSTRR